MKIRNAIGIIFICLQIGSIVYARFIPERFFCWAPYDNHSYFEVSVTINGEPLTEQEVVRRYQYRNHSWEHRSIHNIFSFIKQYENTYGKNDNAEVKVVYATNGHAKKIWTLNN